MRNRTRFTLMTLALAVLAGVAFLPSARSATKTNGRVLILDSTVIGGASSLEATAAIAAGKGVDVVSDATWMSMTAAQFAAYDGIILGDPDGGSPPAAAESNALVWGPVVNGNVVLVGTDPTDHASSIPGAQQLITSAVAFSVASPDRTGAYITLSQYYDNTAPNTPVPMLAGLSTAGTFTVTGVGCYNDAHIVAASPALTGLTDADLSNWSCSVHEAFDQRPTDFIVLAIAEDPPGGPPLPGSEDFPDGTSGVPYILARGEIAPVGFVLTPFTATNPIGTPHTVTATIEQGGAPVVGVTVTFTVTGANPTTGMDVTDSTGVAEFTYIGTNVGTDNIVANYTDSMGRTFTSNTVEKIWVDGGGFALDNVVSRKNHQEAGPFDINLPSDGSGIENRQGDGSKRQRIVFNFSDTIESFESATTSCGHIERSGISGSSVLVQILGKCNASFVTITLDGITGASGTLDSASVTFGVLVGDVNHDGVVDSIDTGLERANSGPDLIDGSNFQYDVTCDGYINHGDTTVTKSFIGTSLP